MVFSDDIGMAASFAAGGVKARVEAHLDAGCDVVLVCHVQMVDEALKAMDGRASNTMALAGLLGRGGLGWDGLLADARFEATRQQLRAVPESGDAVGADSGAIDVGNVA